ncbi:MAG: porin [Desulfosalsimonadaceae bacterium]
MRPMFDIFRHAGFPRIVLFIMLAACPFSALAGNEAPEPPGTTITIQTGQSRDLTVELGGIFQADYRMYMEDERADNRFHIRRAQLELTTWVRPWLKLNMEYEFKNDTSDHLQDTYAEIFFGSHSARIGHFKKPFSLEFSTEDDAVYFVERSMGSYLSADRDVGLMLRGACLNDRFFYSAGLFNAEGESVTAGGNDEDAPEAVARLVFAPFADVSPNNSIDWLKQFQFGGSASYAKINLSNLNVSVKTSGMVDTSRNIYVLSHDTKFGVLQDVDERKRTGLEAAWAFKSMALQGEYIHLTCTNLKPAGGPAKDADLSSWYVSALYFPTGETPRFSSGTLKPVRPIRDFNPSAGAFGALGLAARFDHFTGDDDWITPTANVSVSEADATTLAINWILFPMHRIILDYTYTDFSDPIRVRVNPDGSVDYIDKENAITARYSISF